jgi:signal recognition particle GTPase
MSSLPDRQEAINKYFDDFLVNTSKDESLDKMMESFDELIYTALLEKLGYSNSSDEQKKLVRLKMNEFMMDMDLNSPALVDAEKILRSIGASDFKRAAKYLESLYEYREKLFTQAQTLKAKQPRNKDPLTKLLSQMIERDSKISAAEVIAQLESGKYSDVVSDFDEDNIYYRIADGQEKIVTKSNIPTRLTRLRKRTK